MTSPPPTVAVVSHRHRRDGAGRSPGYTSFLEAEDVLVDAAEADLALVVRNSTSAPMRLRRAAGRTFRRATGSTRALPGLPPARDVGIDGFRSRDHYDLVVYVGITIWDLPALERLRALRRRADQVVAWFPEVWTTELADPRVLREPFGLVDHIFVGTVDAARVLAEVLGRPVHYLPMAVDTARFAALSPGDPRPIDVLGIGRRRPDLHDALLAWARKTSGLYVYDTISGTEVTDVRAHRENLADTYRRSSLAITHHAKFDQPSLIGHQREIPGRLWEGLASGAVMVGQPPDPELQRNWPGREVVVPLPDDPHAAVEIIDELHRSPLEDIRRANVALALERNDWGHRWRTVFETAGLVPPPGLVHRLDRLTSMADSLRLP